MPRKKTKQQLLQDSLSEMEVRKTSRRKQLMTLNYKIRCKFKNKKQKEMSEVIEKNRITFIKGVAGTGKSLIALKTGLEILKEKSYNISNIIITKPIVSVGSEIGALPGGVGDKTYIYFNSLYSNLEKLVDLETAEFLRKSNIIEERIINFMRGETFGNVNDEGEPVGSYCILDEGQNTTAKEMKTYISRLGEFSKIVVLYDPDQSDINLRGDKKSGADDAVERLCDIPVNGVGFIEFTEDEIVRDPFLIEIMKRYK